MSLSKIVEDIKKAKPYAEEDADAGPIETLAGRRGRKNQAIEQMKMLKSAYKRELMESAAFIIVTGEKRKEVESIATENFKCFSANPNDFYESLAGRIPQVMLTSGVSNVFDILGRHLEDKARELGIVGYPQLIFKQSYRVTINSREDLVELVKRAINEQVGSEIVGIQAIDSLVNTAIGKDHGAKVTPVILSVDNEVLALDLLNTLGRLRGRGVFLVLAGKSTKSLRAMPEVISIKDPNNETVEQALKIISGTAKANKEQS